MPTRTPSIPRSSVSIYDARPFFEKTLAFGVQSGILDQHRLATICQEAPRGMVQIARYFGSEFLRPELEKARDRMVNLVSLHLEHTSGGDLRVAAEALRDHSFLSRSKGGSDMLKALIAMPQNSHFGMNERAGFTGDHIPLLARWSLKNLMDYQAELAKRSQVAHMMDAAIWLADRLGLSAGALEDAGIDAEAVIRTALLTLAHGRTEMPDWARFEKMVVMLRRKPVAANGLAKDDARRLPVPKSLPHPFEALVQTVRQSVLADLPKILDSELSARKLFDQTPAFIGRYFWIEDSLSDVDSHDRRASRAWDKATGGHGDEGSLLTFFLCLAAGVAPKTLLTEKGAAALLRKMRKTGCHPDLSHQYIQSHAPAQHQDDYARLWKDFMQESLPTLQSDFDYELKDALAVLRRECNVK